MSTTLNLADRLLAMGRHFQTLGREQDAVRIFNRLTSFKLLSSDVAEETKARLAEILVRSGRLTRARRHLTALLLQCPAKARYHYLMATALDGDERSDPQRATEHYRQSLKLDPQQPRCLGEYGLLALRSGRPEEGLKCLADAVELAPNDPEVVGRLAEGLRQEGRLDEARAALRAARFRNPRDGRFTKLWNDFQFRLLHDEQEAARDDPALLPFEPGPRILPFVHRADKTRTAMPGKVVRRDAPAALKPRRLGKPDDVPGKKHA